MKWSLFDCFVPERPIGALFCIFLLWGIVGRWYLLSFGKGWSSVPWPALKEIRKICWAFCEFGRLLSWLPRTYFRVIHSVRNLPKQKKDYSTATIENSRQSALCSAHTLFSKDCVWLVWAKMPGLCLYQPCSQRRHVASTKKNHAGLNRFRWSTIGIYPR